MRLPLEPTRAFLDQIVNSTSHSAAPGAPPLLFIESEPFLVELQGSLELEGFPGVEGTMELMRGVQVGKVDLEVPARPILRIAHHRLEGRLVTLAEPYAILRTTPSLSPSSSDVAPPPSKRVRLNRDSSAEVGAQQQQQHPEGLEEQEEELVANATADEDPSRPKIEIVGLVRRKIVFSKRPEPMVELSSELGEEGSH